MSLFFVFLGDLFGILLKKEFLAAVSFSCFKPWAHCDVGTLGPAPRKMLLTSQEWRNTAFLWHRLLKKKKKKCNMTQNFVNMSTGRTGNT